MPRPSAPLWMVPSGAVLVVVLIAAVALYAGLSSHSSSLPDPALVASACAALLVEGGLHWVTLVALFTVTILATASISGGSYRAVRRWRRQRRLLALSTSAAWIDALDVHPSASQVRIVASSDLLAFTWGVFRPRTYFSQGLIDALSPEELQAVFMHEDAHRRRRDPLQRLLLTLLSDVLFYVPVLVHACRRLIESQEIRADRAVWMADPSRRRPLATALAKLIGAPVAPGVSAAPSSQGEDAWRRRVAALVSGTDQEARLSRRDLPGLAVGLLPALVMLAVVLEPVAALHATASCS